MERKILLIANPIIQDMGFEVIRIRLIDGKSKLIQIMIDSPKMNITVDDCANVSNELSAAIDVEDPYEDAFNLEVSSPGFDRKLTKVHYFDRFVGAMVRLKFRDLVAGKKNHVGLLGKSTTKNSIDMIKQVTPNLNNPLDDETSSIFFIEEKGTDGTDKIEFGIEQLEHARLVEEISLKGKHAWAEKY